jgi:hypothetical protein
LGVDKLVLEGLKGIVVQVKLEPERSIGHASSLSEELHGLIKHGIKFHDRPSILEVDANH